MKSPVIPWLLSPNAIFNQQHPWRAHCMPSKAMAHAGHAEAMVHPAIRKFPARNPIRLHLFFLFGRNQHSVSVAASMSRQGRRMVWECIGNEGKSARSG